ncbi:MAG TPA: AmmeMemoRadiSam system protein B [Syntrophales bacterium]|nr:AmmeMemoRadiSam system protein B [Syntrophales bacterium]HOX95502.1 AmmeMemoRadiSam system protein B [Syntrophales bacterium]HPI58018.1 AmmeMemoRadiSam system protein B [Syntrophales bacterium]HPN25234.1 AmmeMemoRadiSam system protein B [Syntrophales bacterium]HQM29347.1 AmmeMemoRadiSam system protein B [Syntrophales bacterium]
MEKNVRKPVIAGTWYPGDPAELTRDIKEYLKKVPGNGVRGRVVGLISPHAGYIYSGQIAAHGYKLVQGRHFDSVIVIGPSHRSLFRGASVYPSGGYETPLGVVPVDGDLAGRIIGHGGGIAYHPQAHAQEHSIEIQLPFLQVALGQFSFVPIVMGDQDRRACEELAEAIYKAVKGKKVLVVGSSDLSHFHSYDRAVKLDRRVVDLVQKMDTDGLIRNLEGGSCEACGGGPMVVTMLVARKLGGTGVKVLKYANSGDVTGDKGRVVGYLSAAMYVDNPSGSRVSANPAAAGTGLSEEDKKSLLEHARNTIECRLKGKPLPSLSSASGATREKRGAFVSLKKQGRLRGCIGYIEARKPLAQAVSDMALAAAFKDPRFPPLKREELADLDIEISVLTPLKKMKDINDIKIGRDGLYVVRGFQSGLLLPQVATEYRWDRLTFLKETCYKAGLPAEAWKEEGTEIYTFSAEVFGSRE